MAGPSCDLGIRSVIRLLWHCGLWIAWCNFRGLFANVRSIWTIFFYLLRQWGLGRDPFSLAPGEPGWKAVATVSRSQGRGSWPWLVAHGPWPWLVLCLLPEDAGWTDCCGRQLCCPGFVTCSPSGLPALFSPRQAKNSLLVEAWKLCFPPENASASAFPGTAPSTAPRRTMRTSFCGSGWQVNIEKWPVSLPASAEPCPQTQPRFIHVQPEVNSLPTRARSPQAGPGFPSHHGSGLVSRGLALTLTPLQRRTPRHHLRWPGALMHSSVEPWCRVTNSSLLRVSPQCHVLGRLLGLKPAPPHPQFRPEWMSSRARSMAIRGVRRLTHRPHRMHTHFGYKHKGDHFLNFQDTVD